MPYAWFLASCNVGIKNYSYIPVPALWPYVPLCSCSMLLVLSLSPCLLLLSSFIQCVFPLNLEIACLAFWASDWVGACWTSLSDYPPLLGVCPSMTFVKLFMIGHCCDHFGGWLNCLAFTHWIIITSRGLIMCWWLCPSTHSLSEKLFH